MLISVIIPTYKPGDYLAHLLDALGRQTLPADQFQVIIVLNGDRDPYLSEIQHLMANYPSHQMELVFTPTGGVSHARNVGLERAKGTHICFFDDDDWPSPEYLELLAQEATANGGIVCSNVIAVDESSHEQLPYFQTEAFKRCKGKSGGNLFAYRKFLSTVWGKLIPRQVIGAARFDTRFQLGEDALFMFVISRKVRQMTLASPKAVYYVRMRHSSLSRSHYSWCHRGRVLSHLAIAYFCVWIKAPLSYNFPLFLSREAATLYKLTLDHYE